MSKCGSFFTKRKRVELYKNIITKPEQRFIIKNKNLEDEMYEI